MLQNTGQNILKYIIYEYDSAFIQYNVQKTYKT